MRNILGEETFRAQGRTLAITASIGATLQTPAGDSGLAQTACLQTCEAVLSQARDAGRNRLVMATPESAPQPAGEPAPAPAPEPAPEPAPV